ncbi:type II secretion system protein N [Legionella dresdenensis]|uniref:Type II secretion system protein N n=1 Tax=Legionella dresdenensis TaxID=450200 RepID=A0ABV8CC46_9GAMM
MKANKLLLTSINDPGKMIALAVIVVAGILFIIQLFELVRQDSSVPITPSPVTVSKQEAALSANSPVFTNPLFGNYVPDINNADIKQSRLDLSVLGIMYSEKEDESQVLLKAAQGEEKTYVIGDTVPGGAVIKRITENGIVVLHNGALESLSLPKNELIFDRPAQPLNGD